MSNRTMWLIIVIIMIIALCCGCSQSTERKETVVIDNPGEKIKIIRIHEIYFIDEERPTFEPETYSEELFSQN